MPPDRARIIAVDVRGHGESAWSPAAAYQYPDQAGDLAAFVDTLGLERFVLIGTSMGGRIAMAYAVQHADRLRALVLNDIGPDAERGSSRITTMVGSRPDSFPSLEAALGYLAADLADHRAAAARRPARDRARRAARAPRRQLGLEDGPGLYRAAADPGGAAASGVVGGAGDAAVPDPIRIWGTDSDVLSEAQARRMVETLPKGELSALPGVGHLAPTLVEPEALAALERLLAAA